jgi:hypothetical protein
VRKKLFDVHSLAPETHPHDQAVAIAPDIEDSQHAHHVRGRVGPANVFEAMPFRLPRRIEPVLEGNSSIGVFRRLIEQIALADDVQNSTLAKC